MKEGDRGQREFLAGTLGVDPDCSPDELHSAYKDLAKIHHPDLGGDADFMKVLSEAYDQLVDLLNYEQSVLAIEAGAGWDWNEDEVEETGENVLLQAVGAVVPLVILIAVAVALVAVALWFLAAID